MTTTANQFLYYCDGVLVDDHTLVIPSGFLEHPDAASSRILFMLGNEWMSDDFEDDILISVTYENGICYLLGRNGVIATLGKSGAVLSPENIAGTLNIQILHDAQKRGNMERIRAIGGGGLWLGRASL